MALFLLLDLNGKSLSFWVWDEETGAFTAHACKQSKEQEICLKQTRLIQISTSKAKKGQIRPFESQFCSQ